MTETILWKTKEGGEISKLFSHAGTVSTPAVHDMLSYIMYKENNKIPNCIPCFFTYCYKQSCFKKMEGKLHCDLQI